MIHIEESECIIKGHRVDIAIEYAQITKQMLKMCPSIVIAVIGNFSDDVDKAILMIDPYDVKIANNIVKIFKNEIDKDKH